MIDFKRPKKEDYDFNDNIEGVRYAKDMNEYADKLEEQLRLYNVSQQRELLIGLLTKLENGGGNAFIDKEQIVDDYLKAN